MPLVDQVAARYELDPSQVQQALGGFDELLDRRAARRRAATRELIAELYAQDDEEITEQCLDAEAEATCAQERDHRLAALLRHLVTPEPTVTRQGRTLDAADLDGWCQAAVDLLGAAPGSLAEFHPEVQERHALDLSNLEELGKQRAQTAWQLQSAPGWRLRRRRLRRELADLGRAWQAADQQLHSSAVRLAAIEVREAERADWLAEPLVRGVLARGAAAVRELLDRAQATDSAATAELPVVAGPQPVANQGGRQ
jgi:hypothetical protein